MTAAHGETASDRADCTGYDALSRRDGGVVTSIYTHAGSVYGFGLTIPGQPVCQSPEHLPTNTPATAIA